MPVGVGNAIINTHVRIAGVDSKANILAIGTGEDALHGRLYLTNVASATKEVYIGNWDGTLTKIGGGTSWIASDGANTVSVTEEATLKFLGSGGVKVAVVSGEMRFSVDSTGQSAGKILTANGSGGVTWEAVSPAYITSITDTNSIDLTVSGAELSAALKVDANSRNNISVSGSGVYVPKMQVAAGSSTRLAINPSTYEISVSPLSITDVVVDTTDENIGDWVTHNYSGTEYQEGDTVILTNASPTETWIHNGGSAGTTSDWTRINDGISNAQIRALFSGVTPLSYNSGSGQFSLAGLTTYGTTGQIVTSTGTGWAYSTADSIASNITGAALTKTDDTNVTLTLGGTHGTALLRAASITVGWDGQLAVTRGGTGVATITGVAVGNGTSAMSGVTGTANQLLRRNAANTAYEFFTPTYISGNQTITLSGDVTGSGTTAITTTIANNAVTLAKMADMATLSVIGRSTAGTGDPEILTAGTDGYVLRRSGSTLGFGTIATESIADDAVTFVKMQDISLGQILGRYSSGTGDVQTLTLGSGLTMNGSGVISATAATDTNGWNNINSTTNTNDTTTTSWRSGITIVGAAYNASSYTAISTEKLVANAGIRVIGNNGYLMLTDDTGVHWKITVLSDGSLFTATAGIFMPP